MPKSQPPRKARHKAPMRVKVPVVVDPDVLEALAEAELVLAQADDDAKPAAEQAVEAARVAVEEATDLYVFEAIGRAAFDDLVREHPATDEDHARVQEDTGDPNAKAPWAVDTFAPALIKACCLSPDLDDVDVKAIATEWNETEYLELFTAALAANRTRRAASLGKGLGGTWSGVR